MKRTTFLMLNLHLFDDVTNTTATLSAEMQDHYVGVLEDYAEPKLVHDRFADEHNLPANSGKTVKFHKFARLPKALTKLVEGVTPNGSPITVTELTATVDQYGDFIRLTDVLQLTAVDNMIVNATKLQGSQAGRTLDTISREVLAGGTFKMFAPSTAADGTETEILARADVTKLCRLKADTLIYAVAQMRGMDVPEITGGGYGGIVHPHTLADLMADKDNWQEWTKYTNPEMLMKGEVGQMAGVRFIPSTEAKVIAPANLFGSRNRFTLKTALDGTGSATIAIKEAISAAEATELTAAIAAGTVKIYVGGKEATLSAVTAGAAGSATFTASAAVQSVSADAVVCGYGAGKDGSAIYFTTLFGSHAYGTTSVRGGGLKFIVKQLGSGGTADPLDQRATVGWKAMKVTERLVEENMLRIEHGSAKFSAKANAN